MSLGDEMKGWPPKEVTTAPTASTSDNAANGSARVLFDLTSTALWTGPPVGIIRVEHEFARWGLHHICGFSHVFFDPKIGGFRYLDRALAERLISQDAALDKLSFVSPARFGKRKSDRIPKALQPAFLWLLQARRKMLQALERLRLTTVDQRIATWIDRLQRLIMSRRHRAAMVKPDGSRRDYLPIDMAVGASVDLTSDDTLICAGMTWTHCDMRAIAAQKAQRGFRLVLLCYDIIPLMFPHFYRPGDVAAQREFCRRAFPAADLVIFNARAVEADARAYCAAQGIVLQGTAVCPLGATAAARWSDGALPEGLERGHYALLVSTIEPRKGHRLIYEAWLQLLADGVPQHARFKLVFAGREGWLTEDLMTALHSDDRVRGSLLVLNNVDDAIMAALYENAAFCIYPSRYEGYGLPVVEAFFHGKAVLVSTGGALPEVTGDFSPCLDPENVEAWRRMLQSWIEDPAGRTVYEERIRTSFHHPDWDQSAQTFFGLARGASNEPATTPGML